MSSAELDFLKIYVVFLNMCAGSQNIAI